jgi:hypothetical protein
VRLVQHKRTGDSKGFAFLSVARDVDLEAVVQAMRGRVLKKGAKGAEANGIQVEIAQEPSEKPPPLERKRPKKQLSEHKSARDTAFQQNKHLVQCATASAILAAFETDGKDEEAPVACPKMAIRRITFCLRCKVQRRQPRHVAAPRRRALQVHRGTLESDAAAAR